MRHRGAHPGTRIGRVAAVLLVGVLLAVSCGPAGPQDTAIYVDPVLGGDAQPGTAAAPLRTLTAALARASDGSVIRLAAGTYGAANGEVWPQHAGFPPVSGANVPSGVQIVGAGSSTVLSGAGGPTDAAALVFAGDAEVRDLRVTGFQRGLLAFGTGNVDLSDVDVDGNAVDGLLAYGTADVAIAGGWFRDNGISGIASFDGAIVRVSGSRISANRVGAYVANGSRMLLTDVQIDANGVSGAHVNAGVFVADQGEVVLTDAAVNDNVRGIEMLGNAVVSATRVEFGANDWGIDVRPDAGSPYLELTESLMGDVVMGIRWLAPGGWLIVRDTQFWEEHEEAAVYIAGDPHVVDFGSVGSPGGNLFTASTWPPIVDARPARAAPDGTVATFSSVGVAHGCIVSVDPYVGPFSLVCGPHPIFTIVNANQRLQLVGN